MTLGLTASNSNEYQEHFLGVKAAGAWGNNLTTFMYRLSCNLEDLRSSVFLRSAEW